MPPVTHAPSPARARTLGGSPHLAVAAVVRRRTPLWAVILIALLVWAVGNLAVSITAGRGGASALTSALAFAPALVIGYGLRVLLIWGWVARFEGRRFRTLGFPRGHGLARAGGGFLAGLALFGLVMLVFVATGTLTPDVARPGLQGVAALSGVALLLLGWLVVGTSEEMLYRGFVLQGLGARRWPWLGVAVSSLLFAATHISAWGSPLAVLNLALFGVLASLYALREGGLWGVCGLHVGWNWVQGSVFGLAVSGNDVPGGALLDLRADGPSLLTGGSFGAEASPAATVVLLLGVALTRLLRPAPPVAEA